MKFLILTSLLLFSSLGYSFDKLSNGAPFFSSQDKDLPRNVYIISLHGGPALLKAEDQGYVAILSDLLEEGPKTMSLKDYKEQLFKLGASISFSTGNNVYEIIVRTPPAEQEKVFALLKSSLGEPKLTIADFTRVHANIKAGLTTSFEDMRSVLSYFAPRDLLGYPSKARDGRTSPSSFDKLTFDGLKKMIPIVLDYQRMFVAYVGPENPDTVKSSIEKTFAQELAKPHQKWVPEKVEAPKLTKTTYTIIDKPLATDNQIAFIFPQTLKRDSQEWVDGSYAMDMLGGGLHGRLGVTLRVQRGLTYGAASSFSGSGLPYWLAWTFGGVEQTKPLIEGVPEVIEKYKKSKLTIQEVAESKSRLVNDYKVGTELPSDNMHETIWYYTNGYNVDYAEQYPKDLQSVTAARINNFKNKLQTKNAAVYLMGDREVLLKILESKGIKRDSVKVVEISEIK